MCARATSASAKLQSKYKHNRQGGKSTARRQEQRWCCWRRQAETRTTTSGPAVAEAATSIACRAVVRSQPPAQPVGQTGFDTTTVCLKAQKQRACATRTGSVQSLRKSVDFRASGTRFRVEKVLHVRSRPWVVSGGSKTADIPGETGHFWTIEAELGVEPVQGCRKAAARHPQP